MTITDCAAWTDVVHVLTCFVLSHQFVLEYVHSVSEKNFALLKFSEKFLCLGIFNCYFTCNSHLH